MSFLENALRNVVAKATEEYTTVAQNDPVVDSSEDNTARGEQLDAVLKAQREEKKRLWDMLYKLENERIQEKTDLIFNDKGISSTSRKQLSALMYEHRELNQLVNTEVNKSNTIEQPDDVVLEIEFREDLDKQIQQYRVANQYLQEQLDKAGVTLREEKRTLKECEEVYEALKQKQMEMSGKVSVVEFPQHMHEQLEALEQMYKDDTEDLIDFLEEYYPPHPVDGASEMGDECDMKTVLEQLMNQAFTTPEAPYIQLEKGTYWSPYIQTLLKANIIKYHPQDSSKVCLQDFTL